MSGLKNIMKPRIGIIGAGPGGLCAAVKLKQAGFEDLVILEKSDGVGGTWWSNRYPGLTCDVKSYTYAFSFEPNPHWSSHYAGRAEIQAYMERVAVNHDLLRHVRFGRKVAEARWSDADACWRLTDDEGGVHEVDVLVAAQGMFNELNWPDIPGLESFEGVLFHAGAWREDHDLTGRRVAVIGSAASAVQFVPEIAPRTARLHVFQRSPAWVGPKDDPVVTSEERDRLARDPEALEALRREMHDQLEAVITFADGRIRQAATEGALANLAAVQDAALRTRMTPQVPWGCLRPLISNAYYPTFNLPHVELVTEPIERVVPTGVLTRDGRLREADTLICATGYQVRKYLSAIKVTGRDGLPLEDAWADGPQAYLGIMTTGFPNLFMIYGPNTNNGSILYMIERQCGFIVERLRFMQRQGLAWLDVRREAMDAYNAALQDDLAKVEVWQAGCSSYYRTASGRIVTQWPHTMAEYRKRCEASHAGCFEGGGGPAVQPG